MSLSVYLQDHTTNDLKQPLPTDSNGQYLVNWYDRNSFKYYPFQAVMQSAEAAYLEAKAGKVILGGNEIETTIMFSDIYNFTTYSEGKAPTEVLTNLNQYFEKITKFVLENNGLLDKYTGAGIMALFGAPIYRENHAFLACRTA